MIKQAIIPLAGQGTRLLPLTSVFAKELLPMNGKPGIEYIIEECIDAGIKEIVFIISKKKEMIKDYFYKDKFYQNIIKKKKDPRILNEYKKIQDFNLCIVYHKSINISEIKNLVKNDYIYFKSNEFGNDIIPSLLAYDLLRHVCNFKYIIG